MDSQKKCRRLLYLFLALTSDAPFNCKTLCFTFYPSLVFTRDASESMRWEVQTADKCLLPHTAQNHLKQNLAILGPFVVSEATVSEGSVTVILSKNQVTWTFALHGRKAFDGDQW